jgi:hypothetical protein
MVQTHALGSSSSIRFKGVVNRGTVDGESRPVYLGLARQAGAGAGASPTRAVDYAVDCAPRRDVIRWGNPPAPAW